jgi:hypothetical protein
LLLCQDDWLWLQRRAGPLGGAKVVRELIGQYRRKLEAPRRTEGLDIETLRDLL